MEALQQRVAVLRLWADARGDELAQFAALAKGAAEAGKLPDFDTVPQEVLVTGASATLFVLLLLVPRGRRLVIDTVDTALATALCILLLLLLLSLPLGLVYGTLKGALALADVAAPAFAKLIAAAPALVQSG